MRERTISALLEVITPITGHYIDLVSSLENQ